jgi:phage terminase large subunit GpA-like protein
MIIGGKIRERAQGAWLLRLGVDALKDDTFSRLMIEKPGPGFCHFPRAENGEPMQGYGESYFEELLSEQRVLRYNRGGFARYEYHKDRMQPNEALDLHCYNRAALEYLRVRLEQMPRDVLVHLNPQAIEEVEIGLGRRILVEKKGAQRLYQMKPSATQPTVSNIGGLETEIQWIGSLAAGQVSKTRGSKYRAMGQSF